MPAYKISARAAPALPRPRLGPLGDRFRRSPRFQRILERVHSAGVRPTSELLIELLEVSGADPRVLDRLERWSCIDPETIRLSRRRSLAARARSRARGRRSMTVKRMTRAEQSDLLRLGKLNKDGAILAQKERTKIAAAEFEMRLVSQFSYDQREAWADLMASAKAHVAALDQQLAEDCRRLGIPESFRPEIGVHWFGRGENASKERRAELRRVAVTRLAALEASAIARIEDGYRRFQTSVLSAAISSVEARNLLADLPTAEQLLPTVDYQSVTKALLEGPEAASLQWAEDHSLITDDSEGDVS